MATISEEEFRAVQQRCQRQEEELRERSEQLAILDRRPQSRNRARRPHRRRTRARRRARPRDCRYRAAGPQRLRSRAANSRVAQWLAAPLYLIALTGYGGNDQRDRAIGAGFDVHLVKPINPDTLLRLISTVDQ
jgi:hypothetical protein